MAALLDAGAPVGLGVDGAASNEAGELADELRQALLVARLRGGPRGADRPRGARAGHAPRRAVPGREAEIGSLEPGKLADVALWRLDDVGHAGIADPVAALVLGPRPLVRRCWSAARAWSRTASCAPATGGARRATWREAGADRR